MQINSLTNLSSKFGYLNAHYLLPLIEIPILHLNAQDFFVRGKWLK